MTRLIARESFGIASEYTEGTGKRGHIFNLTSSRFTVSKTASPVTVESHLLARLHCQAEVMRVSYSSRMGTGSSSGDAPGVGGVSVAPAL